MYERPLRDHLPIIEAHLTLVPFRWTWNVSQKAYRNCKKTTSCKSSRWCMTTRRQRPTPRTTSSVSFQVSTLLGLQGLHYAIKNVSLTACPGFLEGEFHVDLYTLPDSLVKMLWEFTSSKVDV